jgi:signal transduction histidine kinase
MTEQTNPNDGVNVAWTDVIRFLRQLSHDLRNQLNAVELQSAFMAELAADDEMKEEIKRLRKMVSECGSTLQKLSVKLNPPSPNLVPYGATEFIEDLQTKVRNDFPKQADAISWKIEAPGAELNIDPQQLQEALLEVLRNAFEHQAPGASLHFNAKADGGNLVVTLDEPKAQFELATENWGRQPLRHVNRGHYGLGLNRARTIVENQGGKFTARYDSTEAKLITTITLPVSHPAG